MRIMGKRFIKILLRKILLAFFAISLNTVSFTLNGQDRKAYDLLSNFLDLYGKGDFAKAEQSLLSILSLPEKSDYYVFATYNNLGMLYDRLGQFNKAIEYYDLAETKLAGNESYRKMLGDVYVNRAGVYLAIKSWGKAIAYTEKGLMIYDKLDKSDKNLNYSIAAACIIIGIACRETSDYQKAADYFNKCLSICRKNDINLLGYVYGNLAMTYDKLHDTKKAEEYFLKSIEKFISDYGPDNYKTKTVYIDFALFLRRKGDYDLSLGYLKKAESICLKVYGEKQTFTSQIFKIIGEHYLTVGNADSALVYLQKSLIAVTDNFSITDIFANPKIDSVIFDQRLLDNLKAKARALELLADRNKDSDYKIHIYQKGIETLTLGFDLIDKIRNSYPSPEDRLYLSENEKETYIHGVRLANTLYTLTNSKIDKNQVYNIVRRAKAADLRNEVLQNGELLKNLLPLSLKNHRDSLVYRISSLKKLLADELKTGKPENDKIEGIRDELLSLFRENEQLDNKIRLAFPEYGSLLTMTAALPLKDIQKNLDDKTTILDYFISNNYTEGKRGLYIFTISKSDLSFRRIDLDSSFTKNVAFIRNCLEEYTLHSRNKEYYTDFTSALFFMYSNLVKPVENLIKGKKLIIIPDEEISLLPFDAFLKAIPDSNLSDFQGLKYLLNDYTISYGYSALLLNHPGSFLRSGREVSAFSPGYMADGNSSGLPGALSESRQILKIMDGKEYTGNEATESNFGKALKTNNILHLAMHSVTDSSDSDYSYLLFANASDSLNDGKLFSYEISLRKTKTPMVVLSACNSGTGTLFHGEGIMSLARSFILAGAASVIKTGWEINDETSAELISGFYYHLSRGLSKDEALQRSKLDFMEKNPPAYSNPYYWASYQLLGDDSPLVGKNRLRVPLIMLIIFLSLIIAVVYFRRRRRTD